jgi:hypothetical protein
MGQETGNKIGTFFAIGRVFFEVSRLRVQPQVWIFCLGKVGRYTPNEFAGRYDLGFLPESRKMPQIARHQVVGTGCIGTFQEPVVVGIACDFKTARRHDQILRFQMSCSSWRRRPLRILSNSFRPLGDN